MKFGKRSKDDTAQVLFWGAVLSVLLAGVGYLGMDIWLASTQWLLIATVLGLFAVYMRLS